MPKEVSIIIPVLNEEGNIWSLVSRLDLTLRLAGLNYEMIFVDDNSTDQTREIIRNLAKNYPITLLTKKKRRGKAFSLLMGFKEANYGIIAMIDGDLQYPPEAIPGMLERIEAGVDIVIGDRPRKYLSLQRKAACLLYSFVFGKLIHNLNCDVQSGLKVFKKEILERFSLSPTEWTFDLEFLIKARNAGYRYESLPIEYSPRVWGYSKLNLLKATWEMAKIALKMKFFEPGPVPFSFSQQQQKGLGFHYKGNEFLSLSPLPLTECAFFNFNSTQKIILMGILIAVLSSFWLNWHLTLQGGIVLLTLLYFADLLFNFFLILRSFLCSPELNISTQELLAVKNKNWPKYTIFCPLYKEWPVLSQFVQAIMALDYPKNKLQVLLLLEENDSQTIAEAKSLKLPSYFKILIVPHSQPKTKPKALNFGLPYAKGKYVVIYDAEDIPEPDQLKKAILAFRKADRRTICVQAKLNFYNPNQNIITKIFTAEYSLWFDLILPGLQSLKAPIPLGGTSNHFRRRDLKKIGGWDPFNVTEDCDLGIRLAKRGYRTAIFNSTTFEEANSKPLNWFRQRSRWIKGYIQTYAIHMRRPKDFHFNFQEPDILIFQLVVGGKVLSMFINPLMWLLTLAYFVCRPLVGPTIESFYPPPVMYLGTFCLIIGNFLYLYYYMIGCARRNYYYLIKYVFLVPLYWLAMSLAAWKALWEIFRKPHFWAKTTHGFHLTSPVCSSIENQKSKILTQIQS